MSISRKTGTPQGVAPAAARAVDTKSVAAAAAAPVARAAQASGDGFVTTAPTQGLRGDPPVLNKDIVCPVLGAMVAQGRVKLDENGRLSLKDLGSMLHDNMGASLGLAGLFMAVGPMGNRREDILKNLLSLSFNPLTLRDGQAKHAADSAILTAGKFDEQKFQALVSHAHDGRMDIKSFQEAIAADTQRDAADPDKTRGAGVSVFEFTVLLNVLGKTDPQSGERYVDVDAIRNLYEKKQLPTDAEMQSRPRTGLGDLVSTAVDIARGLPFGGAVGLALAGVNLIKGKEMPASALAVLGAGKARCPHLQGASDKAPPSGLEALTQLH
jgi:hypothetical protein